QQHPAIHSVPHLVQHWRGCLHLPHRRSRHARGFDSRPASLGQPCH
ncbi:hypothetical protein BN1708_019202, partial [Verticillium longisporum]